MPRESLDALEDLPKGAARQVAFGRPQDEVPNMKRPPLLNSRRCRLVRDLLWMTSDGTSRRRRAPRL